MSITNDHDFRSPDQLKSLFRDQQWLITRRAQENGSYQGYLNDLLEAWIAADAQTRQQIHDGQTPTALADCIRYALIHSTIVGNLGRSYSFPSVYSNNADVPITSEFLNGLLPDDPPQFSLETIANIKNPQKRAEALIELAETSDDKEREAVVEAAIEAMLAIQDDYWNYPNYLWERLEPYFIGDRFARYAQMVFASPNGIARAWFINLVVRKIDGKLLHEALDSAFSIHDPTARIFVLRSLPRRIEGKLRARILQQMYRTILKVDEPLWKNMLLVELVEKLTGKQRADVIQQVLATISVVPGRYSSSYIAQLVPHLTRAQRARLMHKVITAKGVVSQLDIYLALWYFIPKKIRQQAINIALQIRDRSKQAKYLARIALQLRSKAAYQEAIQLIVKALLEIRNEDHRRTAIRDVQEYVQDEAVEKVAVLPVKRLTPNIEALAGYRFAFAQRDPQYIAYALGNLSVFMSEELKTQTMSLMVDLALEINLHDYIAEAIEEIAPYLDEFHLGKALEGALQIGESPSRVWALSGLAPYLQGEQREICLREALDATGFLDEAYHPDSWFDVDMAARLLPSLEGAIREYILGKGLSVATQTRENREYDPRIRFLPYLELREQIELATAIFIDAPKLIDDGAQSYTLSSIAPYLPAHLISTAIQSARTIKDDYEREGAMSALIPYLPDTQLALELAQTIEGPVRKSGALIRLLPRLTGELHDKTLQLATEVIETIESPGYRIGGWLDLLPLVDDQTSTHQKIVESMLDYLWAEKDKRRNNILVLCASSRYFSEEVLPADVLMTIGEHVMDICMKWRWYILLP